MSTKSLNLTCAIDFRILYKPLSQEKTVKKETSIFHFLYTYILILLLTTQRFNTRISTSNDHLLDFENELKKPQCIQPLFSHLLSVKSASMTSPSWPVSLEESEDPAPAPGAGPAPAAPGWLYRD